MRVETRHKVWSLGIVLGLIGALLAGLSVFMGAVEAQAAIVVGQSGIVAAFFSGVVLALSGSVAKGLDARAHALDDFSDSELLRLRRDS